MSNVEFILLRYPIKEEERMPEEQRSIAPKKEESYHGKKQDLKNNKWRAE